MDTFDNHLEYSLNAYERQKIAKVNIPAILLFVILIEIKARGIAESRLRTLIIIKGSQGSPLDKE